jgi:hypothetical protein
VQNAPLPVLDTSPQKMFSAPFTFQASIGTTGLHYSIRHPEEVVIAIFKNVGGGSKQRQNYAV